MASFATNIKRILGDAIYGPNMREAIAEAILQAVDMDVLGEGLTVLTIDKIPSANDDYILNVKDTDL